MSTHNNNDTLEGTSSVSPTTNNNSTSTTTLITPNNTITENATPLLLKLATLNCRGLRKTADSSIRNHFIRYLRTHSLDILALQETHASSTAIQNLFHSQFQAVDSIWSPHCGLVCFSPHMSFSNTIMSLCERMITTTVSHRSDLFPPVTISVLYAPATRQDRYTFLSRLVDSPSSLLAASPSRHVLLGDFNYTYSQHLSSSSPRQAPGCWLQLIEDYFVDGVTPSDQAAQPTFARGSQSSCIDFIFLSKDLHFDRLAADVKYVQPVWTDHFMLTVKLQYLPPNRDEGSVSAVGKGLWRANPKLAHNKEFRTILSTELPKTVSSFVDGLGAAYKWEVLKSTTQRVAQSFSRKQAFSYGKAEKLLQKKLSGLRKKKILYPEQSADFQPLLDVVQSCC